MTQPVPYRPPGDLWSQFSADPRTAPQFRASDADRDVIVGVLATAYQDGRLDAAEHGTRLEQALSVKRLGDVLPLVSDIALMPAQQPPPRPLAPARVRTHRVPRDLLRAWVMVTMITNVVWGAIAIASSQPLTSSYYWPIWPMIGVGIPLLISVIFGTNSGGDPGSDPGGDDGHGAIEGPRDR